MADAYNAATPLDSDQARFAAAELRAIKARMDALAGINLQGVFSNRNRMINPNFYFDQDKEGGNYTASGYDLDGWATTLVGAGVLTRQKSTDGNGYNTRLITTTTIDAAIAAADTYASTSSIEAFNISDCRQGKVDASGFTVLLKCVASLPGNYSIAFRNAAADRSYVTTFNIAAANVEQDIIVQVPGDIAGTWILNTNGVGLVMLLDHGSGSNFQAPSLNQWIAGNYYSAAGAIQQIGTLNATFALKKIQISPGQIASPVFEEIKVADQLIYCQRYFEKSFNQGIAAIQNSGSVNGATPITQVVGAATAQATLGGIFKVTKRTTAPTMVFFNPAAADAQIRNSTTGTSWTLTAVSSLGDGSFGITGTTPAGSAVGQQNYVHWTASSRM